MDSSIASGLLGGAISVILVAVLSARLRKQPSDGTLRWGWGLVVLGLMSLAIAGLAVHAFFFDDDIWTNQGEFFSWVALLIGFGAGATYCFAEYFLVRGTYDDVGIEYYTPWTGLKAEKWEDLQSVKFDGAMNWYVLRFRSGKKIRISNMLSGYGGVIERIDELGIEL